MQHASCKFCRKKIYRESSWLPGKWLHYGSEMLMCRESKRNSEHFATPEEGTIRDI